MADERKEFIAVIDAQSLVAEPDMSFLKDLDKPGAKGSSLYTNFKSFMAGPEGDRRVNEIYERAREPMAPPELRFVAYSGPGVKSRRSKKAQDGGSNDNSTLASGSQMADKVSNCA